MGIIKVAIGKGTYPDLSELQQTIREKTRRLVSLNATKLAEEAGNVMAVNMVLLGALIQTGIIPIPLENVKIAIQTRTKKAFLEVNQKAFELGYAIAASSAR